MENNYLYQVFDDKNNELTELKTNKSIVVICQLTELLYSKFIGKYNLKLKTSQLDYYKLVMDIKNDM